MSDKPERWAATPEWCQQVQAELDARGMSQRALARELEVSQGMVSLILAGQVAASPSVVLISDFLDIPLPSPPGQDPRIQRIARDIKDLSDEHLEMVEKLVHSLPKVEKKS